MNDASIFALATLGLVDSVSFMIVTPSLAFYINSLGGSQDFYGFVLAVYSLASFCAKPVLGRWSDASNFQLPYMVSITLSVLGGLLYAIAPGFTNDYVALALVALGRMLGGLGRANSALGFAYVVRACPANKRTSITALLGGVQMVGMAIAPLFSGCLSNVDFFLLGIHFDDLNSVGLLLVVINFASQVVVYLFLPDLPTVEDDASDSEGDKESEWLRIFQCIIHNPHVGVPFLTIFVFNFNWQFIETALAPASFDVFAWGPVEVSTVLGVMAVLVFLGMTSVHKLSQSGVSDFNLLISGLLGNAVGYIMLYGLWHRGIGYIPFVIPVFVAAGSFPFLGAPNRSLFSEAVDLVPELAGHEGTMQALLSMSSSVGGFTAPSMITHYCLRTPLEVSNSNDSREFTPTALFSPLLSFIVLITTFMAGDISEKKADELTKKKEDASVQSTDEESPDEETPLVKKDATTRTTSDPIPILKKDTMTRKSSDARRQCRRMSLMEEARSASVKGTMLMTPMNIIPQNCQIYGDGNI